MIYFPSEFLNRHNNSSLLRMHDRKTHSKLLLERTGGSDTQTEKQMGFETS